MTTTSKREFDMHLACIPSNYSRLIAQELSLQLRDIPKLLHMTGLKTEQFLQDDTLLTAFEQVQIISNALAMTDDPTLGLRMGRRLTTQTHGVMGLLVNSSPNLITALQAIQAFIPTRMQFARVELIIQDEWLECYGCFDIDVAPCVKRAMSEAFAMALFECAGFMVAERLHGLITHFTHPEPAYSQTYADFFKGSIRFSQPSLMVQIPLELCYAGNVSASAENYTLAYRQCEKLLTQLFNQKGTVSYQVKKMMLSNPSGDFSEEDIAAGLFVSKRTLARKLKQEGSGFRQIKEEMLSQQAAGYLQETDMSIEAIAALLHYYDATNFRRAFKRWYGMTPSQFRQSRQD